MDSLELNRLAFWFVSPLTLALLGFLAGMRLQSAMPSRIGYCLKLISLIVLWLSSTPWFSNLLIYGLEKNYPPRMVTDFEAAEIAVVLGGTMSISRVDGRNHINLGPAVDRLWFAAELYKAGKVKKILLSGGGGGGIGESYEAEHMQVVMKTLGVPEVDILTENRSRNTWENARFSVDLIRAHSYSSLLIVTSAMHLPRAMAIFDHFSRPTGLRVAPAPTDHEIDSGASSFRLRYLVPDAASLQSTSRAWKEYLGLLHVRWIGSRV